DYERSVREWRNRNNWNTYIKAWRKENHAKYRDQNTRHVRDHRSRNKRAHACGLSARTALVVGCVVVVLATQGCESPLRLNISPEALGQLDSFLVRLTATFALAAACLRVILHDLARFIAALRRVNAVRHPVPRKRRGNIMRRITW